jgi:hypothetical protein
MKKCIYVLDLIINLDIKLVMKKIFNLSLFLILSLFIISCTGNELGKELGNEKEFTNDLTLKEEIPSRLLPLDYISFVENPVHGLNQTIESGDYSFQLQYKPFDYVIAKSENTPILRKKFVKNERNELGNLQYYTFKIKTNTGESDILKDGVKDEEQFGGRISYFSFQMQADLAIVEGNDTLPCVLYHMERTYGVAPYCTFVLGFEKNTQRGKNKDKKFLFNDRIFNSGIIDFKIKGRDIDQLPTLIVE